MLRIKHQLSVVLPLQDAGSTKRIRCLKRCGDVTRVLGVGSSLRVLVVGETLVQPTDTKRGRSPCCQFVRKGMLAATAGHCNRGCPGAGRLGADRPVEMSCRVPGGGDDQMARVLQGIVTSTA